MSITKNNVSVVQPPPKAAVDWLMNMYVMLSKDEFDKRAKELFLKAMDIQEQMVRHAYNAGWDEGFWEVKESFDENADEKFYINTYAKQDEDDSCRLVAG